MAGRHCTICSDRGTLKRVAEMVAEGVSDTEIARVLGVGRMAIHRHRVGHILAPARAITAAAAKSRDAEAQRKEVIAAAEAGELDPDYLAQQTIARSLHKWEAKLERSSDASEQAGQHMATAALSGKGLQALGMRMELGGHGKAADPANGGATRPRFSVNIYLGGKMESIHVMNRPPELEGEVAAPDE